MLSVRVFEYKGFSGKWMKSHIKKILFYIFDLFFYIESSLSYLYSQSWNTLYVF